MQRSILLPAVLLFIQLSSCAQNSNKTVERNKSDQTDIKVGASCEGCEAIYESPVPFDQLNEIDTFPDFNDAGPKIEISGTIYQRDGKTPAANVVLYVYHTDQKGVYPTKGNEKGWGKRHGYLRGWIKTGANGQYRFYTLVPASYPDSRNPKHIHPIVKEQGKTEYWIEEYLFDDDPFLPDSERTRPNPIGGNGVLKPEMKDGMLRAKRDIILGLNVKNYPGQ